MDIGYWIRTFPFTIYGQKVYLGILYHGLFQRNIHKLFTGTIFNYSLPFCFFVFLSDCLCKQCFSLFLREINMMMMMMMDTYYFWCGSHILLQVDIISTGRYYDDVDITQLNSYSRLVTYTSHVNETISSSDVAIIYVCIYSGIRFAPIYVPNSASSVCITIFSLWHMCVMFYSVICHRIF